MGWHFDHFDVSLMAEGYVEEGGRADGRSGGTTTMGRIPGAVAMMMAVAFSDGATPLP